MCLFKQIIKILINVNNFIPLIFFTTIEQNQNQNELLNNSFSHAIFKKVGVKHEAFQTK